MQVLVLRSTALVISFPSVVALIHICRLSNFFFNFFNFLIFFGSGMNYSSDIACLQYVGSQQYI